MNSLPLFGLSVAMSFVAFGIVTQIYIWPRLRTARREQALIALTVPHTFRFIGLSFLIPGVVSPSLPSAFAFPAAYGDLLAAILAILTIGSICARASFATPIAWWFNLWGTADLLMAFYQGLFGVGINPGSLGAAYFIPTVVVPPLLVTHGLMFWLLLRKPSSAPSRSPGEKALRPSKMAEAPGRFTKSGQEPQCGPVLNECGPARSFILSPCGPKGTDVIGPARLCFQVATPNGFLITILDLPDDQTLARSVHRILGHL